MTAYDLGYHGDVAVGPGLVDLAVNVRQAPLPGWLAGPVRDSLSRLDAYPDGTIECFSRSSFPAPGSQIGNPPDG